MMEWREEGNESVTFAEQSTGLPPLMTAFPCKYAIVCRHAKEKQGLSVCVCARLHSSVCVRTCAYLVSIALISSLGPGHCVCLDISAHQGSSCDLLRRWNLKLLPLLSPLRKGLSKHHSALPSAPLSLYAAPSTFSV